MEKLRPLQLPQNEKKILLHSCCAPCSASILKRMTENSLEPTVYFYNPNIYPREEYEHRKREIIRYATKTSIPFVDADEDADVWLEKVQGHEQDPERGERCTLCFNMRLAKTALYAASHGFKIFATSLGISRWKDLDQVNRAGKRAAESSPGLVYWDYNWRLQGGSDFMEQVAKEEAFYRQQYCGCIYSLRQSIQRKLSSNARA